MVERHAMGHMHIGLSSDACLTKSYGVGFRVLFTPSVLGLGCPKMDPGVKGDLGQFRCADHAYEVQTCKFDLLGSL